MKKTRQVNIRIDENDYRILSLRATQANMSLSKYIRLAAVFATRANQEIKSLKETMEYYKTMALCRTKWLEDNK